MHQHREAIYEEKDMSTIRIAGAAVISACLAGCGPSIPDLGEGSGEKSDGSCGEALAVAEPVYEGFSLSAFGHFHDYPPVSTVQSPADVSISKDRTADQALIACLPGSLPNFMFLDEGVLVPGTAADVQPIGVFKTPDGTRLLAYLHKGYSQDDGEGETVHVSAVFLDAYGSVLGIEQGVSSWYEYEGSIRIRELFHTGGAFVVMESVFDPAKRDQEGRAVSYVNTGGRRMVRRYDFPRDLEN